MWPKIPIRWLRLEDIEPDKLSYYLNTTQWIDWLDKRDEALARLVRSLPRSGPAKEVAPPAPLPEPPTTASSPPAGSVAYRSGAQPTAEPDDDDDDSDLSKCDDDQERLRRLQAVLAEATDLTASIYAEGATFMFPGDKVVAVQRASLILGAEHIWLGMWPAELAAQYQRIYSDPRTVDALIALAEEPGWGLNPNFHLAFRFAKVPQRWYPPRRLSGATYVRQWIDDLRNRRAGGRTNQQLRDPDFRDWLVERGYATEADLPSLDDWLNNRPTGTQLHIRPSVEIRRDWARADAAENDHAGSLVGDVRKAVNQVLAALGEPNLDVLQAKTADN